MAEPKIEDIKPLKRGMQLIEKFSDTISCIELTMRHDRRGYVVGWMEGEPKTDSWDGSLDNQIIVLEDREPERKYRKLQEQK